MAGTEENYLTLQIGTALKVPACTQEVQGPDPGLTARSERLL